MDEQVVSYMEVSGKTGTNVVDFFIGVAQHLENIQKQRAAQPLNERAFDRAIRGSFLRGLAEPGASRPAARMGGRSGLEWVKRAKVVEEDVEEEVDTPQKKSRKPTVTRKQCFDLRSIPQEMDVLMEGNEVATVIDLVEEEERELQKRIIRDRVMRMIQHERDERDRERQWQQGKGQDTRGVIISSSSTSRGPSTPTMTVPTSPGTESTPGSPGQITGRPMIISGGLAEQMTKGMLEAKSKRKRVHQSVVMSPPEVSMAPLSASPKRKRGRQPAAHNSAVSVLGKKRKRKGDGTDGTDPAGQGYNIPCPGVPSVMSTLMGIGISLKLDDPACHLPATHHALSFQPKPAFVPGNLFPPLDTPFLVILLIFFMAHGHRSNAYFFFSLLF